MNKDNKKTLVLLDSHAIIHRAYHALPDFSTSSGEPTGALFGVCTMLFKIISELNPDYIIACYDLPEKTFRHDAYVEYKAGRQKADDSLIRQLETSREIFKAFGIPMYQHPGFEADDILGTIVEKTKKQKNLKVIIASGDMDTLSLAEGERVGVYTLKKGINDTILYNEDKIFERFGFAPKYLPDYKGLRGDPSDNIIGIKGIGEKTATILISEFKTIENIYKNLKKDKEFFKKIGITDRILNLLVEGEDEAIFSKTLATIRRDAPIEFALPEKSWREILDYEKVISFFKTFEFKSLISRFEKLLDPEAREEIEQNKTEVVTEEVNQEDLHKIGIALHLLNSEITNPNLEDIYDFAKTRNFEKAKKIILEEIKKQNLSFVYEEIELPIISIIKDMEEYGCLIDIKYLEKMSKDYHLEMDILEKDIYKLAGKEFNINSPKQLGEILFDVLELTAKGLRKSAGGARSTKITELEKLKGTHPIIDKIMAYREVMKLLSTYIDPLPKLVDKKNRIHAKFSQTGASTGRFSSSDPNLQNIPIRTEAGKKIRNAFICDKGNVLIACDYSQIELRMSALLSQDPELIEVFNSGRDVHSAVASKVFGIPEKDVTSDMRRKAKVINFGILYGMGVTALSKNLNSSRAEAEGFIDAYFKRFSKLHSYLEETKAYAREHGYTKTLFGRRRYFPMINSRIPFIRATAERMAINSPIQGTATADLIKIAIRRVNDALVEKGFNNKAKLILQVHDELVYEVDEKNKDEVLKIIKSAMEEQLPKEFLLDKEIVPLVVGVGIGFNWGEMK